MQEGAGLGSGVGSLLASYGVLAIFAVLLLKEIGLPIPVPGDLILLLAGAQAASGQMAFWQVVLAVELSFLIGCSLQYTIARGPGRGAAYRYGRYVGLSAERLERAAATVRKSGVGAVAVGRLTPGLRIVLVPACGLAAVPFATFLAGLALGGTAYALAHLLLGYVAGPWALAALAGLNLPLLPMLLLLLLAGLAFWLLRRRLSGRSRLFAWLDSGCPVCMAVATARTGAAAEW